MYICHKCNREFDYAREMKVHHVFDGCMSDRQMRQFGYIEKEKHWLNYEKSLKGTPYEKNYKFPCSRWEYDADYNDVISYGSNWRIYKRNEINKVTTLPGVYVIYKNGEIFYIGQSTNVKTRLIGHKKLKNDHYYGRRRDEDVYHIKVRTYKRRGMMLMQEYRLIKKLNPSGNHMYKLIIKKDVAFSWFSFCNADKYQ